MSKKALLNEVRSLLAAGEHGERNCKAHGACIERAVRRLQFHGAGVYEPRGLSDTGLTMDDFVSMLYFTLPFGFSGEVCTFVDGEVQ